MIKHPWLLVGPWYRWDQPGKAASGRQSRPVLQKYGAPGFVNDFLAEPQRSLVWKDDDFVHEVVLGTVSKYSLSKSGKVYRKTDVRKVFLDTHSRFYLVVCELHCDVPGFPATDRGQVCEAGFVVRRRAARVDAAVRKEVDQFLRIMANAQTQGRTLEELALKAARKIEPTAPGVTVTEGFGGALAGQLRKTEAQFREAKQGLEGLAARKAVRLVLEGWKPSVFQGVGAWAEVAEEPQDLAGEEVLPLYPLIPDPKVTEHSARGRSIWFGVLPAGSSDVDGNGNPRFDDRSLYEVRCFVRRHKEGCPKTPRGKDCPGELVWSRATERYRLAPHFDLTGTSNRPVTVQLPDLEALEAQASSLPFGQGVGVRMVSPPSSSLQFGVGSDNQPQNGGIGGVSICSFSIPLITIVATFVLKLFLPIVVLLFQLWFLLKLRFCILPSFSIDAGLAVALDADISAGLDISASLEVQVDASLSANLGAETASALKSQYALNARGKLAADLSTDFSAQAPADLAAGFETPPPGTGGVQGELPQVTANLEFFPRVEVTS